MVTIFHLITNKQKSVWFGIEMKTVTTITFLSIWQEKKITFCECRTSKAGNFKQSLFAFITLRPLSKDGEKDARLVSLGIMGAQLRPYCISDSDL